PRAQVRATSDTETTVLELIRAGVGVGFLPCILASADPNLVRIEPTPPVFSTAIWVLTHHDLRYTGRIRAVMSSLGEAIRDQKSLFEAKD
ncbi:MAG: hypothetical protein JKY56_04520, partial [Kofleriaceae bacterium]|nr:hypothetical protein [Kofleriaceae bacterium]